MVIKNAKIVLINKVIDNGYVVINNGLIEEIKEGEYKGFADVFDANNNVLMPGFIDIHLHGNNGIDFMDAHSLNEYKVIESALYKEGVTSFLATTLTSDDFSLCNSLETIGSIKDDVPSLLGVHMEGPYISKQFKGAQNESFIRNPNIDEFKKYMMISKNNIRNITMAPELESSTEFIKYACEHGITVSCGHSAATYEGIKSLMPLGLSNITHTTNGMDKKQGIVDAARNLNLYCEFIADGVHVSKETIKEYYKIIGPERFILITDALSVKNTDLNKFQLFGLNCYKKNDACYLENGKLAGSLLTMNKAVKNMYDWCDCSLIDLAKISSKNAAKSLHIDNIGEIKEGNIADLVLLDKDFNVVAVFKNGIQK